LVKISALLGQKDMHKRIRRRNQENRPYWSSAAHVDDTSLVVCLDTRTVQQ